MGETITVVLLALTVTGLSFLGCGFALLANRRWLRPDQGPVDQDLDMKLMRLKAAYNLCEQQLTHQFEVSRRRLGEIHQLQAEVRALKFEREARESRDEP